MGANLHTTWTPSFPVKSYSRSRRQIPGPALGLSSASDERTRLSVNFQQENHI
jgi:hypothetical protein